MKNIIDICKAVGVEIPADKLEEFNKAVNENYKTVAEHDKAIAKITAERDKFKTDAENAAEALEKFKDIDPDKMAEEIDKYKKAAEDSEKNFKAELEKRDYNDAIDKLLDGIKFSSEAAKRAFKNDLVENPLQLRNGAVVGFDDVLKQAKEADPAAFVDEKTEQLEGNKAKFTTESKGNAGNGGTGAKTKEEIMAIKDAEERQAAIRENISLFTNSSN